MPSCSIPIPNFSSASSTNETDYPVAVANSVPFVCSGPDDSAARRMGLGSRDRRAQQRHETQYARRAGRFGPGRPSLQGLRARDDPLPSSILRESQRIERCCGARAPNGKAQHPWVPIADYMAWTDDNGRPYDPWLRSHVSVGGKLIGPCERSMVVHEPISFWENWSKERFERSGAYALEGALAPVEIDLDSQSGTYEEPNVWVSYSA